jgi:hypothetical protein
LVGSKDTICSCTYYQEIWSPEFCGSYAPLNLEISRNLLLKQLVSATPLKLLNRISWNLVGSKDTICSCANHQEILIAWMLWELCPFELRNVLKFTTEAACQHNSSETTEQNFNFAMTIWNSTCNPCFSTFDQIFFVFHGLKTVFFFGYSLKLKFICYLNRFFTFDYSLWDRGRHMFLWARTNFNWLLVLKLSRGGIGFLLSSLIQARTYISIWLPSMSSIYIV